MKLQWQVIADHGLVTGSLLVYTGGTLSGDGAPLVPGQTYYAIETGLNTFQLASTLEDAEMGTELILSGALPEAGFVFYDRGATIGDVDYSGYLALELYDAVEIDLTGPQLSPDNTEICPPLKGSPPQGCRYGRWLFFGEKGRVRAIFLLCLVISAVWMFIIAYSDIR